MIVIMGLDPGKRACGVALVDADADPDAPEGSLLHAQLVKNPEKEAHGAICWDAMGWAVREALLAAIQERGLPYALTLLAVERQRIYPGKKTKNPNVILDLAYVVGSVLGYVNAEQKVEVQQSTWGASKKKEQSTLLVKARLKPAELQRARGLELKSTGHNVVDAIGIAKWAATKYRQQRKLAQLSGSGEPQTGRTNA